MQSSSLDLANRQYIEYLASKVGENRSDGRSLYTYGCRLSGANYLGRACRAAKQLPQEYDVGVALATSGLWMAYIAEQFGLPVVAVDVERRGTGATWRSIDKLSSESLKGKKLVLFDNDCITGRTLRRATRELNQYSPEFIDLLLVYEKSFIVAKYYKSGKVPRHLPSPVDIKTRELTDAQRDDKVTGWAATKEGLRIDYLKYGQFPESHIVRWNAFLSTINCRVNAPTDIRKIATLENDFQHDEDALTEFLEKSR